MVGIGPKISIIIRDAFVLQEENHFNVLPKNPPYQFAKYRCNPPHKQVASGVYECHNKEYKIPEDNDRRHRSSIQRWTLSICYQLSPIPQNIVCLSKRLRPAVVDVWITLRRKLQKILNENIVIKGWKNYRSYGSYEMIWYSDFIERPSAEMLELSRNARYIFDVGPCHSVLAIVNTMRDSIPVNIRNITITQAHINSLEQCRQLSRVKRLSILLDNELTAPWGLLRRTSYFYPDVDELRLEELEFIEGGLKAGQTYKAQPSEYEDWLKEHAYESSNSSRYFRRFLESELMRYPSGHLDHEEAHDRGRYIRHRFCVRNGVYTCDQESVEGRVTVFHM